MDSFTPLPLGSEMSVLPLGLPIAKQLVNRVANAVPLHDRRGGQSKKTEDEQQQANSNAHAVLDVGNIKATEVTFTLNQCAHTSRVASTGDDDLRTNCATREMR